MNGYEVAHRGWSKLTSPVPKTWGIISDVKEELSSKKILAVRCPTCGAASGEKCQLASGEPRTTSHRDRRVLAKDSET
jgi:hypothetical protein